MWLEGRPPVTNLYSSAIFIGWGAVVLGLVLETILQQRHRHRRGVASIGFVTLIIAHHLSLGGDTLEMMRAVLDTNFWLATHVVVVTLGYAATFVAGFLALIYILRGVFTTTLDRRHGARALARMVYGIVCFATLFSFVGTVLGGIWADQSLGPLLGLGSEGKRRAHHRALERAHPARALGRPGPRARPDEPAPSSATSSRLVAGSASTCSASACTATASWTRRFLWLMLFVGSQLLLIALGLLPQRYWLSFRHLPGAGVPPPASSAPASIKPGKQRPASAET